MYLEFGDAAEVMLRDQQQAALALAGKVKREAIAEHKSLDWAGFEKELKRYLTEEGYRLADRTFLSILKTIKDQIGTSLVDELGFNELFDKFSLTPLDAAAFWNDYLPPFIAGQNATTIQGVKDLIAEGLDKGWSNDTIIKQMGAMFDQWMGDKVTGSAWLSERTPRNRREMISRTETIRSSNAGLTAAYKSVGVPAKEWYTASDPCEFCADLNGKIISMDTLYFNQGDTFTIGEGDAAQSMSLNYEDVGYPPLHPNCRCVALPVLQYVEIPTSRADDWEELEAAA